MPEITRRLEWDAGHRIVGHEGKCASLHGHRYAAEITVKTERLDTLGRVVDFGIIKDVIGGWIDSNWDHRMILSDKDPILRIIGTADSVWVKAPYVVSFNPTAENMAEFLFLKSQNLFKELKPKYALEMVKVRLYETPSCYAEFHQLDNE